MAGGVPVSGARKTTKREAQGPNVIGRVVTPSFTAYVATGAIRPVSGSHSSGRRPAMRNEQTTRRGPVSGEATNQ